MSRDRSSALPPTPGPTDTWAEEFARVLADQLEAWALDREKVIDRLDVRGARVARSLVRSLRVVARALAASSANPEDPGRPEIMARLIELREDAKRLMADGSDPFDGAILRDLDGEPMSAQRDLFAGRDSPITLSPPITTTPVTMPPVTMPPATMPPATSPITMPPVSTPPVTIAPPVGPARKKPKAS